MVYKLKSSISSYSFQHALQNEGESQLSIIKRAKDLGFDAIEFTDLNPTDGLSEAEYANLLKIEAKRLGMEISGYSISADLLTGSDGDLEKEIERICRKVDIAEILGCKMLRHDAAFSTKLKDSYYNGLYGVIDRIVYGCKIITEYAAKKGIKTMIENHGLFCQDSDRVEQIVNRVDNPNFGVQLDIGNFLCVDENPEKAVGRLASYAFNVHLKDFIFKSGMEDVDDTAFFQTRGGNYLLGTVLGHGVVPIKQCINIIKKSGYNGYLTLEFEGRERLNYALEQGIKIINKYL